MAAEERMNEGLENETLWSTFGAFTACVLLNNICGIKDCFFKYIMLML